MGLLCLSSPRTAGEVIGGQRGGEDWRGTCREPGSFRMLRGVLPLLGSQRFNSAPVAISEAAITTCLGFWYFFPFSLLRKCGENDKEPSLWMPKSPHQPEQRERRREEAVFEVCFYSALNRMKGAHAVVNWEGRKWRGTEASSRQGGHLQWFCQWDLLRRHTSKLQHLFIESQAKGGL